MTRLKEPFLLRLSGKRVPNLVSGLIVSAIVSLILIIIFQVEEIPLTWFNYTRTAYFTFTLGYIVFITRVIDSSHKKGFQKLLGYADLTQEEKDDKWNYFINHPFMWKETLGAMAVGLLHVYIGFSALLEQQEIRFPIYMSWRAVQVVIIWITITLAVTIYMRNMTLMNRISRHIKIDLINTDQLMSLTSAGITSILALIGAYSLLFIQGFDTSDLTSPAILVLVPSIIWMMIVPLRGIRKRITEAKNKEIAFIDAAIEGDRKALESTRIGHNLENINVIDLINYRKQIQNTFEIPVNVPTASRFIFYLIIPVLTWVAASIVDKLIDLIIA